MLLLGIVIKNATKIIYVYSISTIMYSIAIFDVYFFFLNVIKHFFRTNLNNLKGVLY